MGIYLESAADVVDLNIVVDLLRGHDELNDAEDSEEEMETCEGR
jgi:hypothetical protein